MTKTNTRVEATPYPVPSRPVLLVASAADDGRLLRLRAACASFGWPYLEQADDDRLCWAASVHRPSAVLVSARDAKWTIRSVAAIREATTSAVVVIGELPSADVVALVRAGADAVIPAHLPDEEALARVYAVIRRITDVLAPSTRYLIAGPVHVDLWRRSVRLGNQLVHLTTTEFELLTHLMRHGERTLEPASIVPRVWGGGGASGLNTLRIFIGRLRQKLGDDARKPSIVESVRGHGYRFAQPVVQLPDESRSGPTGSGHIEQLDEIAGIAADLSGRVDEVDLAKGLVDRLTELEIADGVGVQHLAGATLRLIAHRGMSEE